MNPTSWLRQILRASVIRPLNAAGLAPAQLATTRLALAALAALLLAIGPAWSIAGGTVFLFALLIDRCAFELADLRSLRDAASLDHLALCDSLSNALLFVGLGVGLRDSQFEFGAVAMGLIAGAGVLAMPGLIKRLDAIDGERASEFGGVYGFAAEDVMLLVPPALWAGWSEGLLVIAAFAAPTFASAFFMTHYRKFTSG